VSSLSFYSKKNYVACVGHGFSMLVQFFFCVKCLTNLACEQNFDASVNLVAHFHLLCSCYVGDFRHSPLDIFVNCRFIMIYFNN
jgi:hypothetical protein